MKRARDRVLRTEWMAVNRLVVAQYYGELFPLPRNWEWLKQSFKQRGYKPEYPIVARVRGDNTETLEIVCVVGRCSIAKERGMKRMPIIVRQFDGDSQAQAYAIEDNLYNQPASARISLVHAISLARTLKASGGQYAAQRIWEFAGVSESTFWRAVRSLDSTLQETIMNYPEIAELQFSKQVSEVVRRNLCPAFTQLFADEAEVHTYHKTHGQRADKRMLKSVTKPAAEPGISTQKQEIPELHSATGEIAYTSHPAEADHILSNELVPPTSLTDNPSGRKKQINEDQGSLLFDP
jgi:hypothetical protein